MIKIPAAFQHPSSSTVPRRPSSMRRTSHVDMRPVDDGGLRIDGAARDVRTDASGAGAVVASAEVHALVDTARQLRQIETTPRAELSSLLGAGVTRGFRARLEEVVPDQRDARTPLYLLLDELPVATLISGYAALYGRGPVLASNRTGQMMQRDICSGWREGGLMMNAVARGEGVPITVGPIAPRLESDDDPLGWHPMSPLDPGAMRRRRLIDVTGGATLAVAAMFRDTYVDEDGVETVLHEYSLEMEVDAATMRIKRTAATPRALPWPECPAAAASATRLEGRQVGELRALVRAEFHGTSTCTHLNDLLRSLADVDALAAGIASA